LTSRWRPLRLRVAVESMADVVEIRSESASRWGASQGLGVLCASYPWFDARLRSKNGLVVGGSDGFDVLTTLPKSGQQVGKGTRAKNGNNTHGMGNGDGNGGHRVFYCFACWRETIGDGVVILTCGGGASSCS